MKLRCSLSPQGEQSPLCISSFNGNIEMVQLLIHHHAAIDQPTDVSNALYNSTSLSLLPRPDAQGVKQSVCPSVVIVVVVGMKIARS